MGRKINSHASFFSIFQSCSSIFCYPAFQYSSIPLFHFLYMARQTVIRHFTLCMTIHAPLHRHLDPRFRQGLLALRDISVTGLALHLSEYDMAPMGKKDMIGLRVNPFPGYPFPFFLKLSDPFLLRTFCYGFLMAFQAGCDVGYSGEVLGLKILVTRGTFQSLRQVFFVVERDRLLGPVAQTQADQDEEQNQTNCQTHQERFHFSNDSIKNRQCPRIDKLCYKRFSK
jgi:hypothetical protein